jgi:hypothetical protein
LIKKVSLEKPQMIFIFLLYNSIINEDKNLSEKMMIRTKLKIRMKIMITKTKIMKLIKKNFDNEKKFEEIKINIKQAINNLTQILVQVFLK